MLTKKDERVEIIRRVDSRAPREIPSSAASWGSPAVQPAASLEALSAALRALQKQNSALRSRLCSQLPSPPARRNNLRLSEKGARLKQSAAQQVGKGRPRGAGPKLALRPAAQLAPGCQLCSRLQRGCSLTFEKRQVFNSLRDRYLSFLEAEFVQPAASRAFGCAAGCTSVGQAATLEASCAIKSHVVPTRLALHEKFRRSTQTGI